MEAKNLRSLMIKHFGFLEDDYGFTYDSESCNSTSCRYRKSNLEIEVQHMNGELNVLFIENKQMKSLPKVMTELLKNEFSYPEHFSSWVLSMGDVDSRLAYDAKLIREHGKDIL
ncbi:MAG: Unknown protein [uncultured Sulfurovum sp.]|uniref:Uncharacterized protein n=1 Tax=uncultured Sulfurovum sp. TaxID=269237 RepID=A0A6S6T9Q6_9BACT|nr:MAG: Unknown protein [uncultured Sulfurovum sp.]